jgi:hypothetical protein
MRRAGRHREPYPLQRITIWIRDGDWAWLQKRYPYKASSTIRELIIEHRRQIEAPRYEAEDCDYAASLENLLPVWRIYRRPTPAESPQTAGA